MDGRSDPVSETDILSIEADVLQRLAATLRQADEALDVGRERREQSRHLRRSVAERRAKTLEEMGRARQLRSGRPVRLVATWRELEVSSNERPSDPRLSVIKSEIPGCSSERLVAAVTDVAEALLSGTETPKVVDLIARHAGDLFGAADSSVLVPELLSDSPADLITASLETGQRKGEVSTLAVPIRSDGHLFGTLVLRWREGDGHGPADASGVRQFIETVGRLLYLGHSRNQLHRRHQAEVEQLQQALRSRIVIEQAKGIISARRGISLDEAFARLRGYARSHNATVQVIASATVNTRLLI